jgi:hypothetical protein
MKKVLTTEERHQLFLAANPMMLAANRILLPVNVASIRRRASARRAEAVRP